MAKFFIDSDWYAALSELSQEDKGYMLDCIFKMNNGEDVRPELVERHNPYMLCIYKIMKASFENTPFVAEKKHIQKNIVTDEERLARKAEKKAKREAKKKLRNPTYEDVKDFINEITRERGLKTPLVEVDKFFQYYNDMNWCQLDRNTGELKPILNWKTKLRQWENRELQNRGLEDKKTEEWSFDQQEMDYEENNESESFKFKEV